MRILVAEDDPVALEYLQGLLIKWGHEVVVAHDGEEAERLLLEPEAPAVAILDWMMPKRSGLDVCNAARARDGGAPYIIMITANHEKGDIPTAFEAGVDDFIAKPVAPSELRARLKAADRIVTLHARTQERAQTAEHNYGDARSFLELVVGASPVPIVTHDQHGNITQWNPAAEKLLGWSEREVLGRPPPMIPPENRDQFRMTLSNVVGDGSIFLADVPALCKDGSRISCDVSMGLLSGSSGTKGMVAILNDITLRKEAQARLRNLNEELEQRVTARTAALQIKNSVFDAAIAANSIADVTGVITECNAAFLSIWGYPDKAEVIGKPVAAFLQNSEDAGGIITALDGVGKWEGDYTARRKDGSTFEANGRATALRDSSGAVIGYQSSVLDITASKLAEASLRNSEERFRIAAETANDVVYEWDLKQNVQWFGSIDALLGYGPGEFPRTLVGFTAAVHPEDVERVMAAIQAHLEGRDPYAAEYRVRRKDGTYRWWVARGTVTRAPDGQPVRWIGSVTDITERKQVADSLCASEERFRALFNSGGDAVFVHGMNADGTPTPFIEVNNIACERLGYRREELLRMSPLEINAPRPMAGIPAVIQRLRAEGRVIFEAVHAAKDGRQIPVEISSQRFSLRGSNTVISVARDITERKKGEVRRHTQYEVTRILAELPSLEVAAPQLLAVVCENMGWSLGEMWQIDVAANVLRCANTWHKPSPPVEQLAAHTRETAFAPGVGLPGRVWSNGRAAWVPDVTKDPNFTRASYAIEAGLHAGFAVPVTFGRRIVGVIGFLHRQILPPDPELLAMMACLAGQLGHFIERKRVEADLAVAKEAADAANHAKSDFLASMSHELRTPLGAIIGFSELLEEKIFGDLNPKQGEYVKDIIGSGRHLLSLINDVLDLAKVEAGKMELELAAVPIASLLEDSLVMVKEKCMKHGIALSLDVPESIRELVVNADERKLKQVMFNLLSNAAKFTPEGGQIRVAAEVVSDHLSGTSDQSEVSSPSTSHIPPSTLLISVSDTGIGIAQEHQAKLFTEFFQVPGGKKGKTAGTGLGLALVRSMVKLHGGRVWVESEGEGRGCTVSLALPLSQARGLLGTIQKYLVTMDCEQGKSSAIFLFSLDKECINKASSAEDSRQGVSVDDVWKALTGRVSALELTSASSDNDFVVMAPVSADAGAAIHKTLRRYLKDILFEFAPSDVASFACSMVFISRTANAAELLALAKNTQVHERERIAASWTIVVDDDNCDRQILMEALKRMGTQRVGEAAGGKALLAMIGAEVPDLIIMDAHMPEMNGYEVIGRLKEHVRTADIRILVVSGSAVEREALREKSLGIAIPVLSKPVGFDVLRKYVSYLL